MSLEHILRMSICWLACCVCGLAFSGAAIAQKAKNLFVLLDTDTDTSLLAKQTLSYWPLTSCTCAVLVELWFQLTFVRLRRTNGYASPGYVRWKIMALVVFWTTSRENRWQLAVWFVSLQKKKSCEIWYEVSQSNKLVSITRVCKIKGTYFFFSCIFQPNEVLRDIWFDLLNCQHDNCHHIINLSSYHA